MKETAKKEGYRALISPMRPIGKHKFPRVSMEEYLQKKNSDGFAEDPWLKAHLGLGAQVLKVCHESMRIEGSVEEWKNWTGVEFVSDGDCEIPGGLVPAQVNMKERRAVYVEPNVWIEYKL